MIKHLFLYIVIMTWLFAFLDWKIVRFTRLQHPALVEWMHTHELHYARITRSAELILCAPCLPLKPIFGEALLRVETSQEEQTAIVHAPFWNKDGFYHLAKRGDSWTFVSWRDWFVYWFPVTLVWWLIVSNLRRLWWPGRKT